MSNYRKWHYTVITAKDGRIVLKDDAGKYLFIQSDPNPNITVNVIEDDDNSKDSSEPDAGKS